MGIINQTPIGADRLPNVETFLYRRYFQGVPWSRRQRSRLRLLLDGNAVVPENQLSLGTLVVQMLSNGRAVNFSIPFRQIMERVGTPENLVHLMLSLERSVMYHVP